MPVPLIGWAAIALGTAVVGYVAKEIFGDEENNSINDKNKKFEYGSTIVIGQQKSGKTYLSNWLVHHKLLEEYNPTMHNSLIISDFMDLPGYDYKKHEWENLIKDKKNIFYLFDMEKFINREEYDKTVKIHITFFTDYLYKQGSMKNKKLIIVGTHLDKIENDKVYKIIDELHKIGDLIFVYGSLQSEIEALKLEEKITKILKDLK